MHGSSTLDYDAVPASLADAAVTPGDPAYGRLTSTYFRGGAPGIVLLPRTVEQVVDAVDFAGRHLHLPLGIRSGGHGLSGRSTNDGGIVIDHRHLNGIHVLNPAARLVRIGPGARWRDVAAALQPHGWALSSGDSEAQEARAVVSTINWNSGTHQPVLTRQASTGSAHRPCVVLARNLPETALHVTSRRPTPDPQ